LIKKRLKTILEALEHNEDI